jgi:hypothetical protein
VGAADKTIFDSTGAILENVFGTPNLFIVEYCGYPNTSCVRPTETSCYQSAKDAADYLKTYTNANITVCGFSLGCGMAIYFASLNIKIDSLILIAPFESVARIVVPRGIYPIFKHLDIFKNYENIRNIPQGTSIKILSGDRDDIIPYTHGQHLATLRKSSLCSFEKLPGRAHNDIIDIKYLPKLKTILNPTVT